MRRIIFLILGAACVLTLSGCSADPEVGPRFRVRNDRATDADLQVKTSGGSTININGVMPNTTSEYREVATGQVDITAVVKGPTGGSFTASFIAAVNSSYTVVVANTTPASVNIVSP